MAEFFIELSIIILAATLLGLIARIFKQPLILAYVVAGILLGPIGFSLVKESESLKLFAKIGVALLLFIVGISLKPKYLKEIGKISLITGIGQVIFTSLFGFWISIAVGFGVLESIYISIALTFSSTIIIIKLLTDKGDLESLYGRIAVGFLLVQDFIAILVLVLISNLGDDSNILNMLSVSIIKALILVIGLFILYKLIVKHVFRFIAKTNELLLLTSITWCFIIAIVAIRLGFSLEIGAFLAGLTLASSQYGLDISAKVKPLRDFFIAIFFINLGLVMVFESVLEFIWPIVGFSIFILIGNPLIVFVLMVLLGYRSRTSFLAGLTVAQISEFSLILMALGFSLGHVSKDAVVLVTTVGIITITASTYLIKYGDKIFNLISKYLYYFERKNLIENLYHGNLKKNYNVILVGCHRMGFSVVGKVNKNILVVDFDPDVIDKLKAKKIDCVYADINDGKIISELARLKPKFVISTIPDLDSNKHIIKNFKRINKNCIVFATCKNTVNCLELYNAGCDFVAYPEVLAGQKISDYLTNLDSSNIKKWGRVYRQRMLEDLRKGNIVF